jgi:hypothetical protein
MDGPLRLTVALLAVMLGQSVSGLLLHSHYRDVEWIKATWIGNDAVTLVVAVPLLVVGVFLTGRGSVRGLLVWTGLLGYAAYNYAFYLFGAALNVFFLLYVAALVLAAAALILVLARVDVRGVAWSFSPGTPVRRLGGTLLLIGVALAAVWITMWAAYAFAGRRTPIEPEAFKLVAALDLSLMVPVLAIGGVLLWRRASWGYMLGALGSIQGSLYLLVLSVNSLAALSRGSSSTARELVIWGTLLAGTSAVALGLLSCVRNDTTTPAR